MIPHSVFNICVYRMAVSFKLLCIHTVYSHFTSTVFIFECIDAVTPEACSEHAPTEQALHLQEMKEVRSLFLFKHITLHPLMTNQMFYFYFPLLTSLALNIPTGVMLMTKYPRWPGSIDPTSSLPARTSGLWTPE